jgi:hypothetical protein
MNIKCSKSWECLPSEIEGCRNRIYRRRYNQALLYFQEPEQVRVFCMSEDQQKQLRERLEQYRQ